MKLASISEQIEKMPVIAILRGLRSEEALQMGQTLIAAGVHVIEIPLNSPEPLESIRIMSEAFGNQAWIGAGTVLTPEDVQNVKKAGGELIVSPNTDQAVIRHTVALGMASFPGVLSPTEAFAAVAAGTKFIKIFPVNTIGVGYIKSLKSVLPKDITVCAVGGVEASNVHHWLSVGANVLGIGSGIYKAGDTVETVRLKATQIVSAVQSFKQPK